MTKINHQKKELWPKHMNFICLSQSSLLIRRNYSYLQSKKIRKNTL